MNDKNERDEAALKHAVSMGGSDWFQHHKELSFKAGYDTLAAENEKLKVIISGKTFYDENAELRAENEKLKSKVIDIYNNPLHAELFVSAQRLANGILLPALEKQVKDLRAANIELVDTLRTISSMMPGQCEEATWPIMVVRNALAKHGGGK